MCILEFSLIPHQPITSGRRNCTSSSGVPFHVLAIFLNLYFYASFNLHCSCLLSEEAAKHWSVMSPSCRDCPPNASEL